MTVLRVARPAIHSAASGRVMVQSFVGRLEAEDIRAAFRLFHEMVAERPSDRHGAITIAAEGAHLSPTTDLAREIAAWSRTVAPLADGSALVIEGTGFSASIARSAISSVRLVLRQSFRERTFSDREEAVTWLAGHLNLDDTERGDVLACVAEVVGVHRAR